MCLVSLAGRTVIFQTNITYLPKACLKCQTIGLTRCFPYLLLKTCCRNESELCSAGEGKHAQREHSPSYKASVLLLVGKMCLILCVTDRKEWNHGFLHLAWVHCPALLSSNLEKAAIFASLVGALWARLQAGPFRHTERGHLSFWEARNLFEGRCLRGHLTLKRHSVTKFLL